MRACLGVVGWTVTAMLLIAACSDGEQGQPRGVEPTPTAAESVDAGSTLGLPVSVTATAGVEGSGDEALEEPGLSPPCYDLTAVAQRTPKPDGLAIFQTQSPFRTDVGREVFETDHVKFYLAPDSLSESRLLEYAPHIEAELTEIAESSESIRRAPSQRGSP